MVNGVSAVAITAAGGSDCGGDAGRCRLIMVIVESVVMVVVIFMGAARVFGCAGVVAVVEMATLAVRAIISAE